MLTLKIQIVSYFSKKSHSGFLGLIQNKKELSFNDQKSIQVWQVEGSPLNGMQTMQNLPDSNSIF